jgi:Transposase DDE domain
MYLVKKKKRGRRQLTCRGTRARGGQSLSNERRQREPWILVTSLGSRAAKQVMRCYQLRMQIEESFRDMKNARLGLHFRSSRSNSAERLSILLLIGTLATLVAWLVGRTMQRAGLQHHYQANTTRHRTVLSTIFLGLQSFRRQQVSLLMTDIKQSMMTLHEITATPLSYA